METCKKQEIESRDNGSYKGCEAYLTSDKRLCVRNFDEEWAGYVKDIWGGLAK